MFFTLTLGDSYFPFLAYSYFPITHPLRTFRDAAVFPMHVGVFLASLAYLSGGRGLPHARGGVSPVSRLRLALIQVFPMHVGVFPDKRSISWTLISLPHARGGVSISALGLLIDGESSPCTWGCFSACFILHKIKVVFPMHVGVFPVSLEISVFLEGLPHARGGVSARILLLSRL